MKEVEGPGPGEVRIRVIDAADLADIHRIEMDSYSVPWSRTTFRNLLYRGDTDMLAAELDGRIVGFVISWFVVDQGEVGNVVVAEHYRRQGIARKLIEASLDRARTHGVTEVYLEVRRSNTGAQRLYRQLGFTQVGVRRNYYVQPTEDALVMRRAIRDVEPV